MQTEKRTAERPAMRRGLPDLCEKSYYNPNLILWPALQGDSVVYIGAMA